MDFTYQNENIINLLGKNSNQLVIPRYQRDYSWSEDQAKTLLLDIIKSINFEENKEMKASSYFFGTILLKGDLNERNSYFEIIDGQQRITTIYILLVALKEALFSIDTE
ncbi:DUF262 domain-containing protein [Lactobacillus sp. S2-2]|nr:DUF262 domain-containing protein [Lactobacillus sp. S2-2]